MRWFLSFVLFQDHLIAAKPPFYTYVLWILPFKSLILNSFYIIHILMFLICFAAWVRFRYCLSLSVLLFTYKQKWTWVMLKLYMCAELACVCTPFSWRQIEIWNSIGAGYSLDLLSMIHDVVTSLRSTIYCMCTHVYVPFYGGILTPKIIIYILQCMVYNIVPILHASVCIVTV